MSGRRKFWSFRADEETPTAGELLLYGPIGPDDGFSWLFDEVTPKQFKEDLDTLGAINDLRVMINSGGGDVFA
ncbi:MAG: Clp protease ClpP, partial [Dehalococcoidia bacterium]|nr:Clp protease ClpP [Dehalococcoidia bacterium]